MKLKSICYFSIYTQQLARDIVCLKGIEQNGVKITKIVDASPGMIKYVRLLKRHICQGRRCEMALVGYLSNVFVPLIKIFSRKKIIYNALCSLYEGTVLDRQTFSPRSFRGIFNWLIDFLAFHCADIVLVESHEQKKFISRIFKVRKRKLIRVWTGADDAVFFPDPEIEKRTAFTVVFRGAFLPATGVEYIVEAADILRDEDINFLILGRGMLLKKVHNMIRDKKISKLELVKEFLPEEKLRKLMLSCHVALGQFSAHPRLSRTIQNKTFEALALGLPYITRSSASNEELLEDGKHCLFVKPADANDLAKKILLLREDQKLREYIANNGYKLFNKILCPNVIGKEIIKIAEQF